MTLFKGKNALIIEADETSSQVLQKMLYQMDVAVNTIQDSIEAGRRLRQVALPDVIFIDLEMPRSNGYNVLKIIREIPAMAQIPLVAYTIHANQQDSAKTAGFNSFLLKPLNGPVYAAHIARILAGEEIWEIVSEPTAL